MQLVYNVANLTIYFSLYIAQFLYPFGWALYLTSALIGVGAAVLWTAQGSSLTLNSRKETMGRNSGIFWAMLQCSLLIGNLIEFFMLRGRGDFDSNTRFELFAIFTGLAVAGTLLVLTLLKVEEPDAMGNGQEEPMKGSLLQEISDAFSKSVSI